MTHPTQSVVDAGVLKPHPRNYKTHPKEQLDHLVTSIREHGFYRNVVVARDYTILAGHGVVQAVQSMGMFGIDGHGDTRVPIVKLDIDPDDPRALKLLVADNELGKMADANDRQMSELLRDVMTADDLLGTGFDEQSLAGLLMVTRSKAEIAAKDHSSEWIGMPEYQSTPEPFKLVMNFDDEAGRLAFMKSIGVQQGHLGRCEGRTWTLRWPLRERADLYALRFEFDEAAQ
jgi:hypothetical protein